MAKANRGAPIPRSRQRECDFCKGMIDSNGTGVYQFAEGWLANRHAGGANAIALPIRRERWACGECIDKLKHGMHWAQDRLFEVPSNHDA